jgi:hypothetical protein
VSVSVSVCVCVSVCVSVCLCVFIPSTAWIIVYCLTLASSLWWSAA